MLSENSDSEAETDFTDIPAEFIKDEICSPKLPKKLATAISNMIDQGLKEEKATELSNLYKKN